MSNELIVIDAGHGRYGNPHTTAEGFFEGTQNHILALHLARELDARGFRTVLTRPSIDDDPSLEERGRLAGERGADLFISLHSNAPGSATPKERYSAVRGVCAYHTLVYPELNAPLAEALVNEVAAVMDTENRGIKTRASADDPKRDFYGVIRHSVASGCRRAILVEHGFHTNPQDSAFLQSEECLKRLARAEAEVIAEYFGRAAE